MAPPPGRSMGAGLILVSCLGFAIASMIVRRAADSGLATFAITLYVGLVRFAICALIVLARGDVRARALCGAATWEFVALCTLRQALGVVSIVGAFGAFSHIPIGDATVLLFTSPVWTTALARVLLGEPTTRTGQFAAVFVCAGVALVARASASPRGADGVGLGAGPIGTVCALVASVSDAAFLVATRAIGRRQDAVTLTMWMGFAIVLVMAPLCLASGVALRPARAADVGATVSTLLCGGVISLLSNVFLNLGLERLEAAPANVLAALQVPAAYFLQVVLFAEPASPSAALGAGIIVSCALAVTLAQADSSAPLSGSAQAGGGGGCCADAHRSSDSVEAQPLLASSAWPAGPAKKSSD